MNVSREQVGLYRALLGLLGLLHAVRFWVQRYPDALEGDFCILPLAPVALSPLAHKLIFLALLVACTGVAFGVFARTAAAYCAAAFLYCELFDYHAFHHDIFLAANLFFFLVFVLSPDEFISRCGIWGTRVLIAMVYLFAAVNKISPMFLSGEACEFLLDHTRAGRAIIGSIPNAGRVVAFSSLVLEFVIPVLLLVPSRSLRYAGMVVGCLFHLGILHTGDVGHMFNLYIPATYLLFWEWGKSPFFDWSTSSLSPLIPVCFACYIAYQFSIHVPLLTFKSAAVLVCAVVVCSVVKRTR